MLLVQINIVCNITEQGSSSEHIIFLKFYNIVFYFIIKVIIEINTIYYDFNESFIQRNNF